MTQRRFYVTASQPCQILTRVAGAIADELSAKGLDVGEFRALTNMPTGADPEDGNEEILSAFSAAATGRDAMVAVGSDFGDPLEFRPNARLSAHLGAELVLVWDHAVSAQRIATAVQQAELEGAHVACAVLPSSVAGSPVPVVVWQGTIQNSAPVVQLGARRLVRKGFVRAAGSIAAVIDSICPERVLMVGENHDEILLALVIGAGLGRTLPAGVLFCGRKPSDELLGLAAGQLPHLPLAFTTQGAASVAQTWEQDRVPRGMFAEIIDAAPAPTSVTPLVFRQQLFERARAAGKHIVLPEGSDDRVLQAADALLAEKICELTILGNPAAIAGRCSALGLDLSGATIVDPETDPLRERFAAAYAELRKAKGVTLEQASERMLDVSYFGTMMVQQGLADGMVSGAAHTTAHTIRPSFEVIKTRKGVSVVSSVFFMCLANQVMVLGDCAVNPNPTAAQLADIAASSAATAEQFGIDPRIAMLSYSTLGSGNGPDVDKVVEATTLAQQNHPNLVLDGPLQFDAAVAPSVARSKAPDSAVAGRANVLIFPDLDAGNAGYKAVQRTAGALAVGPVLQGLNKPINDLSRGALVDDIINTVAITAIQAVTNS